MLGLEQGSANCGPRRQNMWPARYILTKNILFKNNEKNVFMVKTCNQGFKVITHYYYQCSFIAGCVNFFGLKQYFCINYYSSFLKIAARERIFVKLLARDLYKAADPWSRNFLKLYFTNKIKTKQHKKTYQFQCNTCQQNKAKAN